MPGYFDYVNSIFLTKEDLSQEQSFDKDYVPWFINRALSIYVDTVFTANLMNRNSQLPKLWHYKFLLNYVPKGVRKGKWPKQLEKDKTLEIVKEYFQFSEDKAKWALSILTSEQIDEIKTRLNKGGIE